MTAHQGLRLATGVVVENMGTTVLVMIPGQHDVLTLTGPAADVVSAVVAGQVVSTDLKPEVELLLSAGVLTSPMSRRNLLRAGAIGAGAGIAVLSMPSVAAASSPPGGGTNGGAGGGGPSFGLGFSNVDPVTSFDVNAWSVTFAAGTTANITILSADGQFNETYASAPITPSGPQGPEFSVSSSNTLPNRPPRALFQAGSGATFTVVTSDGQTFVRVM